MKPDSTGISVVNYGCDDCEDFGGESRNGVGLAAQHAESNPGHRAWAEQVMNMWWNTGGSRDE